MTTTRDNSGTLARNNRKTQDRHPDIRGQCVIDGRAYWIAGWQRKNEYGVYYSLAFTPKDQPSASAPSTPEPQTTPRSMSDVASQRSYTTPVEPPRPRTMREVLDDDIPF